MVRSVMTLEPEVNDSPIRVVVTLESGVVPSFEEIARLAYFYAEARGGEGEIPEDNDWFRAERALKSARLLT